MSARAPHSPTRGHRRRLVATIAALAGLVIAGGVLLASLLTTGAAFTDAARLNAGDDGVGSNAPFGIVLVADGVAHDGREPLSLDVEGAGGLVPGRSVEIPMLVANNHTSIAADLAMSLGLTAVDADRDIRPYLRVSVLDPDGNEVARAAGADAGESFRIGGLAPRGAGAVPDGRAWSEGAAGSFGRYTVRVDYLDEAGTEQLNGGRVDLTVRVDATSTKGE